LNWYWY